MSFLENLSQWNMLNTKNQRPNPTEMKFTMINCKIRKEKTILDIHVIYQ